jgi:hypothetical protein
MDICECAPVLLWSMKIDLSFNTIKVIELSIILNLDILARCYNFEKVFCFTLTVHCKDLTDVQCETNV